MHDLLVVESQGTKARVVLVAAALCALVFCWFAVRWQLGNMLAELTGPADPNAEAVAEISVGWSPSDPATNALMAATGIADGADQTPSNIKGFERTVRLAPYDYRWRIALGRAYENEDMPEKAEASFRRAVELAPNYAASHWSLGNFYLRQNRNDEAIAELKKAAENDQAYRDQVFSLVWDLFDKDPKKVEGLAGERVEAKARLAYFFAARGQAVDSLRNWNLLTAEEKAANPDTAKAIAHGLFIKKYFPQSLEFMRQAGFDAEAQPEVITNSSFEKGLSEDKDSRFGWQMNRSDPKFEVASDQKVKHDGDRSLKVTFRTFNKPALTNLSQTVVVEPNTRYRLSFWVRTENLRSGGGPLIEIINANDEKQIAKSQPFPAGTNDWQQIAIDVTTPDGCSGITVRTARAYCGEECPITGIFWYDEFLLSRQ